MKDIKPHDSEIEIAKKNPNGWVYRISGEFNNNERIPPSCIVGAWKVDSKGNIEGDFIPNPNFVNDN